MKSYSLWNSTFVLALGLVGMSGSSFAQNGGDNPPSLVAPYLKRGVNVDYIFGNSYAYAKFGSDVFTPVVFERMFRDHEMERLAAEGFDHVRIMVDPHAMGGNSLSPRVPGSPLAVHQNVVALRRFLNRLQNKGLRAIVCLQLSNRSPQSYLEARNAIAPGSQVQWGGMYRTNFVDCRAAPSSDHPLFQFWESFAHELSRPVANLPDFNTDWFALEIMNEPSAYQPSDFNLPETLVGWSHLQTYIRLPSAENWRSQQEAAIQGILTHLPDATVLATTYTSFPESFRSFPFSLNPLERLPFVPYKERFELDPAAENIRRILYAVHVYAPYRFTHPKKNTAGNIVFDPQYWWYRDYRGQVNSEEPLVPDCGPDPNTTSLPVDYYYKPPLGPRHAPGNFYPDAQYLQFYHDEDSNRRAIDTLEEWRFRNRMPGVVVTEFGSEVRYPAGTSHPWLGTIGFGRAEPDVTDDDLYRARWHYDTRLRLEDIGIGWTTYCYRGGFGIRQGFTYNAWGDGSTIAGIDAWWDQNAKFEPLILEALFGKERP